MEPCQQWVILLGNCSSKTTNIIMINLQMKINLVCKEIFLLETISRKDQSTRMRIVRQSSLQNSSKKNYHPFIRNMWMLNKDSYHLVNTLIKQRKRISCNLNRSKVPGGNPQTTTIYPIHRFKTVGCISMNQIEAVETA